MTCRRDNTVKAQEQNGLMGSTVTPVVATSSVDTPVVPCVVYRCSQDFVLKEISPAVFDLIGIRPENLIEKPLLWRDRLLPLDRQRLFYKLSLLAGSAIASDTHKILDDRGLPVWVAHSFRKVVDNGHPAIRGCMVPLSTSEKVSPVDSSITDQFVHRIGNHFQLINLLLDSLKRKVSEVDEFEELQRTVDRAVEFTRSFSRFTQPPVLNASLRLGELLSSMVQSWAPYFNENGVTVENNFQASLDAETISADPFLLDYAIGAIFQNAHDATQNGDRLIVDAKIERSGSCEDSVARILVADTGKGIAKDGIANAVIPFSTTKPGHDGLGLSSAIRIIELHGGVVKVTSEPGRGTEVEILLPVEKTARCSA